MKRVLVIGSHPDDIEYGCGGTILEKKEAWTVGMAVCSYGGLAGKSEARKSEQDKARELLGVSKDEIYFGNLPDANILWNAECVKFLDAVFYQFKPDLVLTPWPDDTHQDHFFTSKATLSMLRRGGQFLYYETPSSLNFTPNVFVDVTNHVPLKLEIIALHHSQNVRIEIAGRSLEAFTTDMMRFRGFQSFVYEFAEAFHVGRLLNI